MPVLVTAETCSLTSSFICIVACSLHPARSMGRRQALAQSAAKPRTPLGVSLGADAASELELLSDSSGSEFAPADGTTSDSSSNSGGGSDASADEAAAEGVVDLTQDSDDTEKPAQGLQVGQPQACRAIASMWQGWFGDVRIHCILQLG